MYVCINVTSKVIGTSDYLALLGTARKGIDGYSLIG